MAIAPPPSLLPAFRRIREMAELPPNWDAEGADPPTPQAVAAALYLIEAMAERQHARGLGLTLPSTSSPIPDGGLQVEWQGRNAHIDVQANPDGSYGFLVKWGTGPEANYEEAGEEPLASLMVLIDRVLGS